MIKDLRSTFRLLIFLTLLTGIGYPLLMTAVGQSLFPYQANGSLVKDGNNVVGSTLIGQNFLSEKYFHSRPSAAGIGYDAANSSGSNLSPTSGKLIDAVLSRAAKLRKMEDTRPIPVDLVTASASGLDPDISVASAKYQAPRIALARGLTLPQIEALISSNTTPRTFGVLGEKRVNVLAINRALDITAPSSETPPHNP